MEVKKMKRILVVTNEASKNEAKKEKAQQRDTFIIDLRKVCVGAILGASLLGNCFFATQAARLKDKNYDLAYAATQMKEDLEEENNSLRKSITANNTAKSEVKQKDTPFVDTVEYQYGIPNTSIIFNKPVEPIEIVSEENVTKIHSLGYSDEKSSSGVEWMDTEEIAYLVTETESGYGYLPVKTGDKYTISCREVEKWKDAYMYFPEDFKRSAAIYVYADNGCDHETEVLRNIKPTESGSYQKISIHTFARKYESQREYEISFDFLET